MSDLSPVFQSSSDVSCGHGSPYNGKLGLRIAAVFVILFTSLFGTLFPIISKRVKAIGVPETVYEGVKYFGSGVIVATAFIHLLAPSFEELNAPCLTGVWTDYSWAPAIAMFSVFLIFIAELIAHRAGAAYLKRKGLPEYDSHSQDGNKVGHSTHGAHVGKPAVAATGDLLARSATSSISEDDEATRVRSIGNVNGDLESGHASTVSSLAKTNHARAHTHDHHGHSHDPEDEIVDEKAMSQIIGVVILEAGVILHSLIIGLTLAVNDGFVPLFIVLIFHQMFEGLGLGSRLSCLPLPSRFSWVPVAGAILYSFITPLGITIGLGVRTRYNPDSAIASIVSGVLDALAAGILLWTGLVELLAHDFIFNRAMAVEASNKKVFGSVSCVVLGAALMALLGRWA